MFCLKFTLVGFVALQNAAFSQRPTHVWLFCNEDNYGRFMNCKNGFSYNDGQIDFAHIKFVRVHGL